MIRLPFSLPSLISAASRPPGLYASAFGAAGIVVIGGIGGPYLLARHAAQSQAQHIQEAAQQSATASHSLLAAGQFTGLTAGQSGSVKTYAGGLSQQADNFQPTGLPSSGLLLPPLTWPSAYPARYVSTVQALAHQQQTLRTTTSRDQTQVKHLLVHESQVIAALSNVLSYNATADFSQFDPHSTDTKKRLQLAADGLASARSSLQNLQSGDDPTLSELTKRLATLEAARGRLAADGKVEDWAAAVSLAQSNIVHNRQVYWSQAAVPLATRLGAEADQLNASLARWQTLSAGRLP